MLTDDIIRVVVFTLNATVFSPQSLSPNQKNECKKINYKASIVPVFNEIGNIKKFPIAELLSTLRNNPTPYEIIYIDDHSTDSTYEWLVDNQTRNKSFSTKMVSLERHFPWLKGFQ